jgi:copper/silver efflux system protein
MSTESPASGVLGRVIAASARNPLLTVLLVAGLAVWGWMSLRRAPLDAIPDLSDAQVIVLTEWPGRSPDLVEDQITYPISAALLAAPGVEVVRGQSMFGLSFVYVIFEDGTDLYWARSRIMEYLSGVQARLPEGVTPTLGPDATGVGWVFQYALTDETGRHDLQQLRALQDWKVRYALESVEGVAEVAAVGGFVKQYQVHVDPNRLLAYGVAITEVVRAVRESNRDVGGQVIEIAGHEHMIRGRGYIRSLKDLEEIPLRATDDGTPVLVRDVAQVTLGPEPRRGLAELDGKGEAVGGIVVMRYGENALRVIERIKERVEEVRRTLPEGVELTITYDRSGLIEESIATLRRTLIHEMVVVSLVIFLFLLHARSALVPILTLPVAVVLAFIPMAFQGLTASIMSLGGIAVAIGALVDGSIIVVENVHKKLDRWERDGRPGRRIDAMISGMQEVGPTIFFALLVITVSFLPVFTLEAVEGRLFKPLAFTKTYSMAFGAVLAVTLTPALIAIFIRGKIRPEEQNPINRWLTRGYEPVVRLCVRYPRTIVAGVVLIVAFTIPAFLRLESEFMPPLHEGAILYMPSSPPGMSITEAASVLQSMDRELKKFPEVETVFGKIGRAETATDPAPLSMVETTIILKPRSEWRPGMTYERLLEEMEDALQYPGMSNNWWMPIETRTQMLATGVRSKLGIQVFGDSLEEIERTAIAIERAVAGIRDTRSVFAERSSGGFYLDIEIDRLEAARHGLRIDDVNAVVTSAIGGMNVSETVEGRERYPISVAYAREFRDDPDLIRAVLVGTPSGAQIPLSQVAEVRAAMGPAEIRSEDGRLVGLVGIDTDRAIVDYVAEARRVIEREVELPPGVRIAWVGQFQHFERAKARFKVIAPLTLALIALLLYFNTRSWAEAGLILLLLPTALVGAVWLLFLLDYNLSVAVWVGIIALAGLDAETSVVMLLYLRLARARRLEEGTLRCRADLHEAIVEGAARRLRPKLMTVLTTMIGLMPLLWSTGTGSDVMSRIAAPMVGGLVSSFFLEMAVYPAIYALWKGRGLPREAPPEALIHEQGERQ